VEGHRLSRTDARRIAVSAQLLDASRPTDLVSWSRLGSSYSPADLRAACDSRDLIEHQATIRTADYLALLRAVMADWPGRGAARLAKNAPRLGPRERRVPTRHPATAGGLWPAAVARPTGYPRTALGLDWLDQQQERHDAVGAHGAARRGCHGRPPGARTALGPGGAGLPGRPAGSGRGGEAHPRREAPARARHRPCPREQGPGGADHRRTSRRAGGGRGPQGAVARRSVVPGEAVQGPGGRRCCRRSTG